MIRYFLLLVLFTGCMGGGEPPTPVLPIPSDAQVRYQQMEFNGFVHFNMNTFSNREWGYGDEDPSLFNPTELDCEQWVSTMKDAGMKGVVLTAKHHDGFCLWPSAYTEHSVKNSPWKNGKGDIVRELSDACAKYGLKFGVYLSPWDRNHAKYGSEEYITYFRNQLRELLTNYGEIFEVWFDGANGGDGYYGGANEVRKVDKLTYYDWENTYNIIYELQPDAIIFSDAGPGCRWIGNEDGFAYETTWSMLVVDSVYGGMPEYGSQYSMGQEHGTAWVPGEADVSIRPGWYYHPYEDHKVKSLERLMEIYYRSVGMNATLLLNFPVDTRGLIHENDVAQLQKMSAKIEEDFKTNLMDGAKGICDNCRGSNFCASNAIDEDIETYWSAEDGVTEASMIFDLKEEKTFNRFVVQEQIRLGQRIKSFVLEKEDNGQWVSFAEGTTIGYKRILRFDPVTTRKIRLSILDARASPTISNVELYYALPLLVAPSISRSADAMVQIEMPDDETIIHYTTDGSEPSVSSLEFKEAFEWKNGGVIKAMAVHNGDQSEVSTANFDIAPSHWEILSEDDEVSKAIDEDMETWWAGNELIINLNGTYELRGFTYLPTQRRYPTGFVEKYSFYVSDDGKTWKLARRGEFGNINNNPITQRVSFAPQQASYIKFVADQTADGNLGSIAELGVVTK